MKLLFHKKITGCEPQLVRSMIREMMESIQSWNSLSDDEDYEFRLILNELIANGTVHGNKGLCNKTVTAMIEALDRETLCITIQDEGAGFNYQDIFGGIFPCDVSLYSERGRGLKLIKAICDDIAFNQSGNQVKISKSVRQKSMI